MLSEKDGLVMMRREMLERLRTGHQGIMKTYCRSQDSVWWPSIRRETTDLLEHCPKFIKFCRMQSLRLRQTELPEKPWSHKATDQFEFEGRTYAIFVDYYSRWIEVVKMLSQTGQGLVRKFSQIVDKLGESE